MILVTTFTVTTFYGQQLFTQILLTFDYSDRFGVSQSGTLVPQLFNRLENHRVSSRFERNWTEAKSYREEYGKYKTIYVFHERKGYS